MYARFGCSSSALELFDRMSLRSSASWNAAVTCCVRAGLLSEAAGLFREMLSRGLAAGGFVVAGILSACCQSADMAWQGAQIHGFVCKTGLMRDVFVGTSLLHLYGSCGFVADVERLFPEIPEKNVVSWTAFMASLSKNGQPQRAMMAFRLMRSGGTEANENSFATAVSACAILEDVRLAAEVLGQIVVSGFESGISVGNSLINLFGRLGQTENALFIFRRLKNRDRISWNSIISVFSRDGSSEEALSLFRKMRNSDNRPDSTTLSSLISSCQSAECLKWGKALHALVLKNSHGVLATVSNAIISMYSLCGSHGDAELMFDEMPHRDLISWNCLMTSYLTCGEDEEALKLLSQIIRERMEVNQVTLATALSACSSSASLRKGRAVHAIASHAELQENLLVGNALITMYGKCSSMEEARRVFSSLPRRDVISWNALIGGFAETEQSEEAMAPFIAMRRAGAQPNQITITHVLGACSSPRDLPSCCSPLHAHIVSSGFDSWVSVKNSLLTAYSKGGDLHSCNIIFNQLEIKSLVSWNVMIFAGAHHGLGEDALKIFLELRQGELVADQFTFSGAMAACSSLALLQEGQQLHGLMIKLGLDSNPHAANAAMDMYAKCGKMDDAVKLFSAMDGSRMCPRTWNILLSGYARHGRFREARATFEAMIGAGRRPDHVTFVSLLSACSHSGLVDEGLSLFSAMAREFRVRQSVEHCVCIVDLLGRAGRVAEAERFVEEMPVQPNGLIWRSLLSSCRIHGELRVGKKAAERLLEADPQDDSAYVLLSNVYAARSRWGDVETVRARMELAGMRKKPGCSWVRLKNTVSTFGSGEAAAGHPQAAETRAKMEELMQAVRRMGYVPETQFVFHDMDEEEKELSLWAHSEKVALAFALVAAPPGAAITVYKNLRVCGDCHLVYKLVSGALGREIILRDCYRFHHFAGGACSCSDYW